MCELGEVCRSLCEAQLVSILFSGSHSYMHINYCVSIHLVIDKEVMSILRFIMISLLAPLS